MRVFELLRDMRFKLRATSIYTHFSPSNFQDNPGIQENPGILFIANIVCLGDKFRKNCLGDITVPYESPILGQLLNLISLDRINLFEPRFEFYDPWDMAK